jgi:hypothetical protein
MLKHQNITFIYRNMNLLNYYEFILEKVNDEFPFFYSSSFKEKIERIDSNISSALLDMKYAPFNYSMANIGTSDDTITVVPASKLLRSFSDFDPTKWNRILMRMRQSDELWTLSSVEMKIGRFIKRVFGDDFKDSEIEEFVNKWKSLSKSGKFELWPKHKIKDAYNTDNYTRLKTNDSNPLINSCMNDMLDYIDFYNYGDNQVLVLLDDDGGITGRALVWTDSEGRIIMDRAYYMWDSDYHKFIKYAKDNGWYYKTKNMSGGSTFTKDGEEVSIKSKVKCYPNVFTTIDRHDYTDFPYMDTYYYAQGNWIMNYEPVGRYLMLQDTEGGYEEYNAEQEDPSVYSKEQRTNIDPDESIYLTYNGGQGFDAYRYDSWVEVDYIENPRNGFVKSKMDNKWYKEKHCVWSEREDSWLYRPDSIYNKGDWSYWDNFNPGGINI